MLWNASMIKGYAILASDGGIGTVRDFLFDDASWLVRWLVVDTGDWLSGRQILLPPTALGGLDPHELTVSINLTRQQVKDSPEIDTDRSVSRQMETDVYNFYNLNPYWCTDFYMGGLAYIGGAWADQPSLESQRKEGDPHLRSTEAVTGYHIQATDGEIGHVEDFLLRDTDWSIHYLAVDTKNWWPGKKVLISPRSVKRIDWTERLVDLSVDRQKVKDSPPYDASTFLGEAFQNKHSDHYGR